MRCHLTLSNQLQRWFCAATAYITTNSISTRPMQPMSNCVNCTHHLFLLLYLSSIFGIFFVFCSAIYSITFNKYCIYCIYNSSRIILEVVLVLGFFFLFFYLACVCATVHVGHLKLNKIQNWDYEII